MHGFHDLCWHDQQLLVHINATVRLPARGHRNWTLHWVQRNEALPVQQVRSSPCDFHRRAGNLRAGKSDRHRVYILRNLGHDGGLFPQSLSLSTDDKFPLRSFFPASFVHERKSSAFAFSSLSRPSLCPFVSWPRGAHSLPPVCPHF
jgi:hypothetical protein